MPAPFIVGTGRSGTTLLRMMLDAHSELAIPPETNFNAALNAFEENGVESAVGAIVRSQVWGDCALSADEFAKRVDERSPTAFGDLLRVFYRLYAEQWGKPRWGDKSPYYIMGMALIHRHLPEAHFVHVIRDGRDFALSTIPLWFGPDTIEEAAIEWVQIVGSARRQAERLPNYIEVRYEDLVCDPGAMLNRLCEFLKLDWEASMLDYHRHARQRLSEETVELPWADRVISRSERMEIHRLLDQPPQRDRIGRWRREMSAVDLRAFESIAGEMLEALGYEVGVANPVVGS